MVVLAGLGLHPRLAIPLRRIPPADSRRIMFAGVRTTPGRARRGLLVPMRAQVGR
jgi:hypothetical protein